MEFFLNPNVAYLIIVLTTMLIFSAVVTPGTGVLEILAFGLLLVSGVLIFSIEFNPWALLLIALSLVPFVAAVYGKHKRSTWLLPVSMLMLTVGSIFLFTDESGRMAVNPLLAIVTSILADGFLWFAVRKGVEAQRGKAQNVLLDVIGEIGEAKNDIHREGSVLLNGELWSARSEQEIPSGSKIRVTGRDGFILLVEKATDPES
jgi:membrane-bound serine protease (ClpP class)